MTVGLWPGVVSSGGSIAIPSIGENVYGGYYAGLIDTTRVGSIDSDDEYQTGAKYLLIVAPQSLETTSTFYPTFTAGPSGLETRWDGLSATTVLKNASSDWAAATYCYDLSYPSDAGSRWYLPAMDELVLVYRNLKPTTTSNLVDSISSTFPGGFVANGNNISSDPSLSAHTSGNPGQTSVTVFKTGGSESMDSASPYWSVTKRESGTGFRVGFSSGFWQSSGYQNSGSVRPVRRVLL